MLFRSLSTLIAFLTSIAISVLSAKNVAMSMKNPIYSPKICMKLGFPSSITAIANKNMITVSMSNNVSPAKCFGRMFFLLTVLIVKNGNRKITTHDVYLIMSATSTERSITLNHKKVALAVSNDSDRKRYPIYDVK